jgi:hypothetical protein
MYFEGVVGILVLALFLAATWKVFTRRGHAGPAAIGTMYGFQNEDKRKAAQVVIEERAEARDPEDADGNLPDLERRGQSRSRDDR